MEDIQKLKSYADLRRLVAPDAFAAAMNYLAWHNRLKMTAMLPVRQALVIAFLADRKPIDQMLFPSVKTFLDENGKSLPASIDGCRLRADELARFLAGQT
ncbi:MAG: hypothetical protein GY867_10560 [bacterium]|nr:hypothetical protein [bacterium]